MNGKIFRYQSLAIVWAVVIVVLCCVRTSESDDGAPLLFEGFDKLAHLGFFFVLTVLLFYGKIKYQHNYTFRSLTIFKIIFLTALLGGGIELLQWKFFTYRSAEWWDFICDMLGVFMGVFSYALLHFPHYNEKNT